MNIKEDLRQSTAAVPDQFNEKDFQRKFDQIENGKQLYSSSNGIIPTSNDNDEEQSSLYKCLTKEEIKCYLDNPYWKRIRWIILILYLILVLLLFLLAIVLILVSFQCPPKRKLIWYEKEFIYQIDLKMFGDSNGDGIGDIQGLEEKLPYLEKNSIKSILFHSSIFNSTSETFQFNQTILNQTSFNHLQKLLRRKDMHLLIHLPLSSKEYPSSENKSCEETSRNIFCEYLKCYQRYPLDFNQKRLADRAEWMIEHWLSTKKVDGILLDLPLELNNQSGLYQISYRTINQWNTIQKNIQKKSKEKLIFFDIPLGLNDWIVQKDLQKRIPYSILEDQSLIDSQKLNQRIQSFKFKHFSTPKFWQLGSLRKDEQLKTNLPKEMILTMTMLFGGTPIVLYGEELALEQETNRFMLWNSSKPSGGFSSCVKDHCLRLFSSLNQNISRTNVKFEEATDGRIEQSFLMFFRYLSKLRQSPSFEYGLLETGSHLQLNLFWFIREAPGHRGFIIVFNLNDREKERIHFSLYDITDHLVSEHLHLEYQWPTNHFSRSNRTYIHSDNLFLHSQSITIFSWTPKFIKPKILFEKAPNHLANEQMNTY